MAAARPILLLPGVVPRSPCYPAKVESSGEASITSTTYDSDFDSPYSTGSEIVSGCSFQSSESRMPDIQKPNTEDSGECKVQVNAAHWCTVGKRLSSIFAEMAEDDTCGFDKQSPTHAAEASPVHPDDFDRWHAVGQRLARVFNDFALDDSPRYF